MQYLALLTTLFESVLVFDETGEVIQRAGVPVDFQNVLEDERLSPFRGRMVDCIHGIPFEAYFAVDGREKSRWRGVPHAMNDGKLGGILAIEGSYGNIARTRPAGSEFDFVLANMRQGFLRRNAKGAVAYANDYMARLFELTPEEMIGRHIAEFIPGCQNSQARYEAEVVTSSGVRRRAIVCTAPLIGPKGRVSGYIDVVTDITTDHALRGKLVAEVQKMSQLAQTDVLTGLANRMVFQENLDLLLSSEIEEPFGLVMVDLDQFKEINDRFGHTAGDEVLQEFAARLKLTVRDSDVVARLGGDEFAILLIGAPREMAAEVVERLIERMTFQTVIGGETVTVRASAGWAHSDDGASKIFQSADRRMYRDKRKQREA
jgi:diguanylate cyclase (GGDEF)-like protein